jgi:hypothetical protein
MIEDVVIRFEDAVREPIVAHELPDVLDRIELGTGVDIANLSKAVCHGESDKCRFGNPPQESNFQRLGVSWKLSRERAIPVTGTIEMKIWAEFVGIDGVLARPELIVIRRDVEQTFPNLSKPTKS